MEKFQELRKNWIYHWVVSPNTNHVDKPEWYLKYTKDRMEELIDTVKNKQEFILFMLDLVMIRLRKDKLDDDEILVHTYNEVVLFTKIIRKLLGEEVYKNIDDKYDLLGVFSTEKNFEKIAAIEWACAYSNLENISRSTNRWDRVLDDQFFDPYKIPRCVDQFLMLINAIKDRAECFREEDCQLKLIELQCSLFDSLLVFLKKAHYQTPDCVKLLKIVLKEKRFLPKEGLDNPVLLDKIEKLSDDYEQFYTRLLECKLGIRSNDIYR